MIADVDVDLAAECTLYVKGCKRERDCRLSARAVDKFHFCWFDCDPPDGSARLSSSVVKTNRKQHSVLAWNTAPLILAAYFKQVWAFNGMQLK